jgi:hypothetical protein
VDTGINESACVDCFFYRLYIPPYSPLYLHKKSVEHSIPRAVPNPSINYAQNAKPLFTTTHKKKKKGSTQNPSPKSQTLDFAPIPPPFYSSSGIHQRAKEIVTRVGFEPTPFRTSVLDVM